MLFQHQDLPTFKKWSRLKDTQINTRSSFIALIIFAIPGNLMVAG